jgi:hypothetical protein
MGVDAAASDSDGAQCQHADAVKASESAVALTMPVQMMWGRQCAADHTSPSSASQQLQQQQQQLMQRVRQAQHATHD